MLVLVLPEAVVRVRVVEPLPEPLVPEVVRVLVEPFLPERVTVLEPSALVVLVRVPLELEAMIKSNTY